MPSLPLERRQYYSDCYGWGCDGNSGWNSWGRWILLALIIGVFLISFLLVCTTNKRRLNRGQQPITGTSWIVPPTYHQSEQQYQSQAAPPYNPNANSDPTAAGYYDQSGNFVNTSQQGTYGNNQGGYTSNDAYGPPPGDAYGPPPGPPPGHSNIEMDQYQPPSHPPPAFVKN
ncbi:Protein RCR2 [Yarrowia sp. C11]|nr:Protein RCR2 [Yarrowia sp. C11]KAG5370851.1 Protein RCR2 [Yarrowia sp. E02]